MNVTYRTEKNGVPNSGGSGGRNTKLQYIVGCACVVIPVSWLCVSWLLHALPAVLVCRYVVLIAAAGFVLLLMSIFSFCCGAVELMLACAGGVAGAGARDIVLL